MWMRMERAAVVGAGTMGAGIAMVFADAGIPVLLKERDQAALERGMEMIRWSYGALTRHGAVAREEVEERLGRITGTLLYEGFEGVDVVVEAVYESLAVKESVFRELDAVCRVGTVLASNTSSLNVDEIARFVRRPEAVIGLHFFTPPNLNPLVEIVPGKKTAGAVTEACAALVKRLGKVGVEVGNCTGFVANRMFFAYHHQAETMVEDGARAEAVDEALTGFGMAMGPLAIMDLVGLDVGWQIREAHGGLVKAGARRPFVEDRMYRLGRFGRKTGLGYYRYGSDGKASADGELEGMVRGWAAEQGLAQRAIGREEIVERGVYALVNEGARIVEEGVVKSVADVDTIMVTGYGFPAEKGGPMRYADAVGLKTVYGRICEFAEQDGDTWRPAPLLRRLAEAGGTFYAADSGGAGR